jgi:hypothetical protein
VTSAHNWRNISNYNQNGGARRRPILNSNNNNNGQRRNSVARQRCHDGVAVDGVVAVGIARAAGTLRGVGYALIIEVGGTDQALRRGAGDRATTVQQLNACIDACARARPVRLRQPFNYCNKHKQ